MALLLCRPTLADPWVALQTPAWPSKSSSTPVPSYRSQQANCSSAQDLTCSLRGPIKLPTTTTKEEGRAAEANTYAIPWGEATDSYLDEQEIAAMNHTLNVLLRVAKSPVKYSPALWRQISTSVFVVKHEHNFLTTIHERDIDKCYYKNAVRYYSFKGNNDTKHVRNRHALMHLRDLSSPAPGGELSENELKGSVEVVKDVPQVIYEEENWIDEIQWTRSQKSESVLLPPSDVSDIDVLAPELRPSFNLAAYVNKSYTLQQLMKLGVDLSIWDGRANVSSFILPLDFERHIKQYIVFLHDVGVGADNLGQWLTVNPYILKEKIENLQARISYLETMSFSSEQIARVISKNPYWLLFSTVDIDSRLGFFQQSFELTDKEVRYLTTKQPRLITYSLHSLKRTSFAVLEEMGFEKSEVKSLLLGKPKIWKAGGVSLLRRFDFAHNHMGLPHTQLVQFPEVLLTRDYKLKERHGFLKHLGRDQYDPCEPNYVSPKALVSGTDAEFCTNLAKSSVQAYNDFLKTL
ncbi:Transcription termination factor 3, mitochondrial [Chionoecetes opilio]|uniref:Transcription termination factor 3, mitochondrial n=1 Tax=Chionoecetes opilio TaxID=41210 RepID=A0A8J4Y3X3_CHIOP|nr:Transcription termination factor 3, mitochondrial [Chionoecetes opilio]